MALRQQLKWCAALMHEDVCHLLNHPKDRTEAFNKEKADLTSRELQKLLLELEARAGQPEELKSERAERLREKMEKRLGGTRCGERVEDELEVTF